MYQGSKDISRYARDYENALRQGLVEPPRFAAVHHVNADQVEILAAMFEIAMRKIPGVKENVSDEVTQSYAKRFAEQFANGAVSLADTCK